MGHVVVSTIVLVQCRGWRIHPVQLSMGGIGDDLIPVVRASVVDVGSNRWECLGNHLDRSVALKFHDVDDRMVGTDFILYSIDLWCHGDVLVATSIHHLYTR